MQTEPSISGLRDRRKQIGLTQLQAAKLIGISLGWYATVEKEPTFLSPRLAKKAAEVFGCEVGDLKDGAER